MPIAKKELRNRRPPERRHLRGRTLTVEAETADQSSMLELYRTALQLRRAHLAQAAPMTWLPTPRTPHNVVKPHLQVALAP
jgi:hypothetical protein